MSRLYVFRWHRKQLISISGVECDASGAISLSMSPVVAKWLLLPTTFVVRLKPYEKIQPRARPKPLIKHFYSQNI